MQKPTTSCAKTKPPKRYQEIARRIQTSMSSRGMKINNSLPTLPKHSEVPAKIKEQDNDIAVNTNEIAHP